MSNVLVDLGFSGFSYLEAGKDNFALHYCTYSEIWIKKYKEMGYGSIDPVIDRLYKEKSPFLWGYDDFIKHESIEVREFAEDAREHGISQGISIPLRSRDKKICVLTIVTPSLELETGPIVKFIKLIAENFNIMFLSLRGEMAITLSDQFSEREKECMTLTALGASNSEVAEILEVSKRTVEQHIQAVRNKIGAPNISSAIVFLNDTGIIQVNNSGFSQLSRPLFFGTPSRRES